MMNTFDELKSLTKHLQGAANPDTGAVPDIRVNTVRNTVIQSIIQKCLVVTENRKADQFCVTMTSPLILLLMMHLKKIPCG